jgi:hypothetical protein
MRHLSFVAILSCASGDWPFDPSLVEVYENALPEPFLDVLEEEIAAIEEWQMRNWWPLFEGGQSMSPDMWYNLSHPPRIYCEQALQHLAAVAFPNGFEKEGITGVEWWAMRTRTEDGLELHHDKDECFGKDHLPVCKDFIARGQPPCTFRNPVSSFSFALSTLILDAGSSQVKGSILYVRSSGPPTLILQSNVTTLQEGAHETIPGGFLSYPERNKYVTFRGDLNHMVAAGLGNDSGEPEQIALSAPFLNWSPPFFATFTAVFTAAFHAALSPPPSTPPSLPSLCSVGASRKQIHTSGQLLEEAHQGDQPSTTGKRGVQHHR